MTSPTPPRRRWFRYSLRTLFVVVTVFCVWLGVQVKWIHDRHAFLRRYPYFLDLPAYNTQYIEITPREAVPWSLRILGEQEVDMLLGGELSEAEQRRIRQLFPEAYIETGVEFGHSDPLNSHAKRP